MNFNIYTGKSEDNLSMGLGEKVGTTLTQPYTGKNYCIYFNHFFSSIPLIDRRLNEKIFACGTIRQSRKEYPTNYIKKDSEIRKREFDLAQAGYISVAKWKDRGKKCVTAVSSMHDASAVTTVLRRNNEGVRENVNCPEMISTYNKDMGGVDAFDQYMSFYCVNQKSRRWWIKIFNYLFEACVVNSYILYKLSMYEKKK